MKVTLQILISVLLARGECKVESIE